MAANTVTEVIKANAEASDGNGEMTLTVSENSAEVQTVLRGLELHMKELASMYPENITLKYGGVKNA